MNARSPRTPTALVLAALLLAAPALPARAAGTAGGGSDWVVLGYRDLIDPEAILRDGRNLSQSLATAPLGYLQPFLEAHSSLLPYGLEMMVGADEIPQKSILERYPPGAAEPAWVALFRAGKYLVTSDGRGKARIFLPGDSPAAAWKRHYPTVRHALASLLPADGSPLAVEVFAFRNDFRKAELRLRLRRHLVARRAFPSEGTPPDLGALEAFFQEGGELEGIRLSDEEGLTLFALPGPRPLLAGSPLSLADLAVAYRAAFHAGENQAFVSLDPHRDVTRSSVNFGGYLEDTRIGRVVLDADRRFKTLVCGLDPDTSRDVREETRRIVPGFLTTAERAMLGEPSEEARRWAGLRYWFYPDSIGVDTDPGEGLAVITRPFFTAEAERKGEARPPGGRAEALPAKDRETIRHLNAEHARYAKRFPEIEQLSTVARLLAVAAALKGLKPDWLDLDALLAVELPACGTPRDLTRMLALCHLTSLAEETITERTVARGSRVEHLSPALDRTLREVFPAPGDLAGFLRLSRPGDAASDRNSAEAAALLASSGGTRVRELVRTEEDLSTLAGFIGGGVRARAQNGAARDILEQLEAREAEIGEALETAEGARRPALEAELARVRVRKKAVGQSYHGTGEALQAVTRYSIHVLGGIDLQPDHFAVRKAASSPAIARFKELSAKPGSLLKSRAVAVPKPAARPGPAPARSQGSAASARPPGAKESPTAAPPSGAPKDKGVRTPPPAARPSAEKPEGEMEETALPAAPRMKKLTARIGAGPGATVVGEVASEGRIVFTRAPR